MTHTPEELQKMLASKQAKLADLLIQYGTGVRPSWVSTDESILHHEIKWLQDELDNAQNYTAYGERPECDFETPKKG